MTDLPEPQMQSREARHFVGLADTFTMQTRDVIPRLYEKFFAAEVGIENAVPGPLYGMSLDMGPDGTFRYAVAREVTEPGARPEGFCDITAPACDWAVFSQTTPMTEMTDRFDAIFSDWVPKSGRSLAPAPVFECYPDPTSGQNGIMLYEIWVPLQPE